MWHWIEKHLPIVVFAGLVGVGALIRIVWHYCHIETLDSTAHVMSDSLIIAGILGATVDTFLKRALIRDVGAVFIGWALPDEIRAFIREVTRTSIVRRDYRISLHFTRSGDDIVIDAVEEWDVYNYSSATCDYQSHIAVNLVDRPELGSFHCEQRIGDKCSVFDARKLQTDKHMTMENTRVIFRIPKIRLSPQNVEDVKTTPACRMKWTYRFRKNIRDVNLIHSTVPIIGVSFHVKDECGLGFELDPEDKFKHADGSMTWHTRELFMPQHAISIRWFPKSDNTVVQSIPGKSQK